MQRTKFFGLLTALLLSAIGVPASAHTVPASIDRTSISETETVNLTIDITDQSGKRPDLTPLSKDFDIIDTAQSNQIQIINGRTRSKNSWTITLAPKRAGTLTIPALDVGNQQTEAISLRVEKASAATAGGKTPDILIEAAVDNTAPYVQSQVILTLKIYHSVPLREASLSKIELPDVVMERLGDDITYNAQRDQRSYEVIERRFALFPQRSGTLTIPAVILTGKVPDKRTQSRAPIDSFFGDPFGMLQTLLSVRSKTDQISLNVQAKPSNASATTWLPASNVTLTETWQPSPPNFRVGVPVTRTLSLKAEGVPGSQLPSFLLADDSAVKIYPDQPVTSNQITQAGLVGTLQQKVAFIGAHPGRYELPPIEIPWWNVTTKRMELAKLPGRTLEIAAGENTAPSATSISPAPSTNTARPNQSSAEVSNAAQPDPAQNYWRFGAYSFATVWLLTVALWWWQERRRSIITVATRAASTTNTSDTTRAASQRLRNACASGDTQAIRDATLALAAARWRDDPPHSLGALAQRLTDAGKEAVLQLDAMLYGKKVSSDWNQAAYLANVVPAIARRANPDTEKATNPLPELYPEMKAP